MTTPDPLRRLNRWERLRELPPADEAAFHVETADDPIAQADLICAGCNDDWPCAFERGRRAEYALLNEPCGYAGMAPTGRGKTPHEAAEPWTCVGPKGHAPAAHTFVRAALPPTDTRSEPDLSCVGSKLYPHYDAELKATCPECHP